MKKILNFLASEEVIIIFLSLILLGFSYGFLVWQYLTPPSGKVYLGSFGYPVDFFGNLGGVVEGKLGSWQYLPKYTSTLTGKPTLAKFAYIFLGQLNRLFPLDMVIFFHLCRLILTLIFILLSYLVICQTFPQKHLRLTAFILAFFSTAFGSSGKKLMDFWTPLTVFQRAAYYPHYLFSFVFVLAAILFLNQALSKAKLSNLVFAGIFGFLALLSHPPSIIILYLCFPFYLFLVFLQQLKSSTFYFKSLFQKGLYLTIFVLASFWPLYYLLKMNQTYPWNLTPKYDLLFNLSSAINPKEFFAGIGPTAILAVVGAFLAIKKKNDLTYLMAPWTIVYILGFFWLWRAFGYNSARFLQTPFYIFLGIFSAVAVAKASQWLAKKVFWKAEKISYLLTSLILLVSLPAYKQSLKTNSDNFRLLHPYVYASREKKAAFDWLTKNSGEKEIVLSEEINGMLISTLVGNDAYLTSYAQQVENLYPQLAANVRQFFGNTMNENQAKQFLVRNKIKIVFFGQEEKKLASQPVLKYPFLRKVFGNSEVIIYKTPL